MPWNCFTVARVRVRAGAHAIGFFCVSLMATIASAQVPGILVPPGFRVDHYADDDLAHDIHSLTIDSHGRVVVSGPGYVRILIDEDNDGKADSYRQFSSAPKTGAQGMFFIGPHLLCSGDEGLQIFRDDDGNDEADGPGETFLKIAAGGEHHVHSIQKGPDGWWYIIAGNAAGVTGSFATLPTSPLKDPNAGVLLRLTPDLSGSEIISDGLRNAYDFAFNSTGDVFTFDSDGERDVSLPWYRPCRVFHLIPRSNAGWLSRSWKRPDHFPDMPRVVAAFGRGSPTGVTCYQHLQFPGRFRGALFVLDWTFGRVLVISLEEQRGLWNARPAVFAKGSGQFGFAPTDIEVAPDGSLFVSVGGRGTRGSIYRIVHEKNENKEFFPQQPASSEDSRLQSVLSAPQPQSSWSRARWYPAARQLGRNSFAQAAMDEGRRPVERVRAIEILTELFDGPDAATARILTTAHSVPVRARTAWSLGRSTPESRSESAILTLLNDSEPLVVRFALEALTTIRDQQLFEHCLPRVAVALGSKDTAVRRAASNVVVLMSAMQQRQLASLIEPSPRSQVWMGLGIAARSSSMNVSTARIALQAIQNESTDTEVRTEALRLLQLSCGDVGPQKGLPAIFDGYTARADLKPHEIPLNAARVLLANEFPSGNAGYDHELIRTIGMLGSVNQQLIGKLLQGITSDTLPSNDIHRLAALCRITGERVRSESQATAAALVNLEIKIREQHLKQDSNWDDRIGELSTALCQSDSAVSNLIVEQSGFGLPGHVVFLNAIPGDRKPAVIGAFVRHVLADDDYEWTKEIVSLLSDSTVPQHQELLRSQVDNPVVHDAVLQTLARSPRPDDRHVFLEGLGSPQLNSVKASAEGLLRLSRGNNPAEQYTLLITAERLKNDEGEFRVCEIVVRLLQRNMAQNFGFVFGSDGHRRQRDVLQHWRTYLKDRFPDDAPPLEGGKVAADVLAMLHQVQWEVGDPERGKQLFTRLSCARCHGGRKALGPDLLGISKRFSRDDLFAAIVDPNRDISPRYQTTTVATTAGKVYTGLIVYESVDGVMLRDSDHKTYRIEADDIESRIKRRVSLMPSGLLNNVVDQDLADLDAYLRRL
ncbi:MAG: c-type cytochrome [Fuerstiella sp.]